MATATIYFSSQDLLPSNGKWRFWLTEPPLTASIPEVRGSDVVVPAATGRVVGSRVADRLVIGMEGFVGGQGADGTAQRADFLASWGTLAAVFDPTAAPAALVVYGPLHGVASGKKRTITARFLNAQPTEGIPGVAQKYRLEFEVVTGASFGADLTWVEADNP